MATAVDKLRGEALEGWRAKNARLNAGHTLQVGDRVTDRSRNQGRVIALEIPEQPNPDNAGLMHVQLDNGEWQPYHWWNWHRNFRVEPGSMDADEGRTLLRMIKDGEQI